MPEIDGELKRFERRVRIVRSWRGLAIGACLGSLAASVWAGLDWAGVAFADWSSLGLVVGGCALAGGLFGLLQRIPKAKLTDSIDRRGALEDRLSTSLERSAHRDGFDSALHADAESHLQVLQPRKLYPIKLGRWHGASLALAILASSIFILGNTPVFLNDDQKKAREEVQAAGKAVERIAKPLEDEKNPHEMNADEKKLADELRRLAREMEKAKISKEEALQKANELQKEAERLVKEKAKIAQKTLADAESAYEKLEKAELEKAGMADMDPKLAEQLSQMSDSEKASMQNQLQQQMESMQQSLEMLQQQMASAKDQKSKDEISQKIKDLEKQIADAKQQMEQIELSKNVKDMLDRLRKNPVYKEILEALSKMKQANQQAASEGKQTQLTHEQIEELKKKLEELAKQLKDDAAMTEYLKKLLASLGDTCGT